MQLDNATHSEVERLSQRGNVLAHKQRFEEAKSLFIQALRLIPEPHSDWQAVTWLYAAVGDMHFRLGNTEKTMRCFTNAVQYPGGLGNPFIHLRLGQPYFDLKNLDNAADELPRAYMGAGMDIFREEYPKYFEFLEKRISI